MSDKEYGYVEHQLLEVQGFRVVDATATGPRAHDDLVWVGYGGVEGRWLSPEEAVSVAASIAKVVAAHVVRRHGISAADAKQRVDHLLNYSP
ncbi:MAG: hypothetical protein Q7U28_09205 [Aquabacterium sp.]|nr:hypothetical protein [Aquabacterium sp.]